MKKHHLTAGQISAYQCYLSAEERAPATVEKYLRDIHTFTAWLGDRAVTKELAAAWKAELLSSGISPSTVNSKLSAINGLFRFLGWDDCRVIVARHRRLRIGQSTPGTPLVLLQRTVPARIISTQVPST